MKGATLPAGFTESLVANGLSNPTAMAFAPDGRIFVCLQGGELRVVKNGVLLPTPFLTVNTDSAGERGLLGIAFDPNFQNNKFIYVYYTTAALPKRNRVSRFTANGDTSVPNSEVVVLELNNLSGATNHNGGAIHFGPDGKLYIAAGENATPSNSQTLSNLLGKILRLNTDGSIPTDNPFFNSAVGINRTIWALGLRNPFTFDFQPGTGRMLINDVGQSTWEEINEGVAGSNYGWPQTEGPTSDPNFRGPIFSYGRTPSTTGGCAITGGTFYNPITNQFPSSYTGKYFFADFCSGWIRVLDLTNTSAAGFASGIANPVDLKLGIDGSLYYLARGAGAIFKIQYPANQAVPTVMTEDTLGRAIALDSVNLLRDPFSIITPLNLSQDQRLRVLLFASNIELQPGETYSVVTAQAEDSQQQTHPLTIEFVGKVPSFDWLTEIVVKLPDQLIGTTDIWITVKVRGVSGNRVLVKLK